LPSWKIADALLLTAKGFCMGAADVVPGVSGGTMAFILGIYSRLIAAINSFDHIWIKKLLKFDLRGAIIYPHFGFLIPLVTGIVAALLFFTRIISLPELILTHPQPVYALFFGLITGSALVLMRDLTAVGIIKVIYILIGTLIGFYVVNLVPRATPEAPWFIFIAGSLAITAMILPGISGSFILLILGKYELIFNAVGHFDFKVLLPFLLGVVTGLVLFSRFLGYVLCRFRETTLALITGILIGSLWIVWPFQDRHYEIIRGKSRLIESSPHWPLHYNSEFWVSVVLMFLGAVTVIVLTRLARGRL
jgi:putative membrane protein